MFWGERPDKRMESWFQTLESLSNVVQVWWQGTTNVDENANFNCYCFFWEFCRACLSSMCIFILLFRKHWDLENSLQWGNRLDDRKSFSNTWNLLAMQCKFDDKGTIDVDWNRQRQLLLSLLRVLQNLLSPQCVNSINFHNTWTGEDVMFWVKGAD